MLSGGSNWKVIGFVKDGITLVHPKLLQVPKHVHPKLLQVPKHSSTALSTFLSLQWPRPMPIPTFTLLPRDFLGKKVYDGIIILTRVVSCSQWAPFRSGI